MNYKNICIVPLLLFSLMLILPTFANNRHELPVLGWLQSDNDRSEGVGKNPPVIAVKTGFQQLLIPENNFGL